MLAILLLTLRELTAKKITMGLFVVSTLVWVMLAFAVNLDIVDGTLAGFRIFGQNAITGEEDADFLQELVIGVQQGIAGAGYWTGILLALFATAPLIGALLEPGRVDLMLSKPLGRPTLLAGHLGGIFVTVLVLAVYLMGMVWLVMSVKSGIWNTQFLKVIPVAIAMFIVMYSVVLLIGVTTQSTALSLIVTYGLIFCSIIFVFKTELTPQINPPWRQVFLGFYHVLPNFAEMTKPAVQLAGGQNVESWYPLLSSAIFGSFVYIAAFFTFSRRDF